MIKRFAILGCCLVLSAQQVVVAAESPAANKSNATAPNAAKDANAATAAPSKADQEAADKAWKEVLALSKPPSTPADWKGGEPTEAQKEAFRKQVGEAIGIAAEKAREFYIKYPTDPRAIEAQKKERLLLMNAINMGQTNRIAQLQLNPILSDEDKFRAKVNELNRKAMEQQPKGMEAVVDAYVSGLKDLRKEFPHRDELPAQLLSMLRYMEPKKKADLARYIAETTTDESMQNSAKNILKTLPGTPVSFKFTALDGREVDTSKMKGKVVLIDFWATWCGPCMQFLPDLKAAYSKYKDEGFEIIGISADRKLADLQRVLKNEKLSWPQYFDQGGPVSFVEEFGIEAFPTMWLLDKNGVIRETEPRINLDEKIRALLAEK